ncbi:uncharacterized protein GIQ15_04949 [Arthroderma uncinatum]|uniref:uncharacterized protein n=1 Tax=Arthroderma uncinatum TaxID=74035 RepID=UPI00144ADFCB|nr:uncharacterized protein GIQ15_04949 [Arthroderma uncinatum]KAF3482190.1 hypothetical protein GIQ15_04949 [Arthroderma uncinatum]
MADPLSITASIVGITAVALKATKSLYEMVKRYKCRDTSLRRLQNELEDFTNILNSLIEMSDAEPSVLKLLEGPIERCSQVCSEFEQSMEEFARKPKIGILDWTKMEFKKGDINEFIDTIGGYKLTISVGLGIITLRSSTKVSSRVLQEFDEKIKDTEFLLEVHLQRIDEKRAQILEKNIPANMNLDLRDEREVTKQCLRVCEDAKSYMDSLTNRESFLLREASQAPQDSADDDTQTLFEAQLLTRQALEGNRNNFAEIIGILQKRLRALVLDEGPGNDRERIRLQEEISISKQCLEVCKVANEVSHQKIYRVGEVVAEGSSDQVVVNTFAGLFMVKKASAKDKSAQLVGSMSDEALRNLTDKRYNSRFGTPVVESDHFEARTKSPTPDLESQRNKYARSSQTEQSPSPKPQYDRATSNEVRKRGEGRRSRLRGDLDM